MMRFFNKRFQNCFKRAILINIERQSSSSGAKKKVFLHDFHLEKKAKIVDFAGYLMPIQYADLNISASHRHTREHVSIFDVSHMLQTKISGKDRIKFIESLVVSDIEGLESNQGTLTLFTNESGGIIDDLIVTKTDEDYLYIVSNAGCSDKDLAHMQGNFEPAQSYTDAYNLLIIGATVKSLPYLQSKINEFVTKGADVKLEIIRDKVLLAIQGPGMTKVLQPLTECDLNGLTFMKTANTKICGVDDCRVTRCGYTGEDGVEISIPANKSKLIAETLLESKQDEVRLAGLGARDTLRLEAGLCLYGNDITDETTPIEAGLAWTIGKRRREQADFPGAKIILEQLKEKPKRKRVGFISQGACPRASTPILNLEGNTVGKITSGCPSPCLSKNVSMGYIDTSTSKVGTKVKFLIHKKEVEGTITKMPFVSTKYYIK